MLSRDFIEKNPLEAIRQYFDSDIPMTEFLNCYDGFTCRDGLASVVFSVNYVAKVSFINIFFSEHLVFVYSENGNYVFWKCEGHTYFYMYDWLVQNMSREQRIFYFKNIDIFTHRRYAE